MKHTAVKTFIALIIAAWICQVQADEKPLPRQVVDIPALACRPNLAPEPGIPPVCSLDKKMVWAHYVSWHQAFNNYVRNEEYYEHSLQHDATILDSCKREIAIAQACGIDGFLIDSGGETGIWETRVLFEAAKGSSFLIAICQDFPGASEDEYVKFSVNMVEEYSKTIFPHPNYAKIDGKPIIASFAATRVKPSVIARIRKGLLEKGIEFFYIFDLDDNNFWCALDKQGDYRKQGDLFYSFVPSYRGWNGAGEPLPAFRETFEKLSDWAAADGKKYMLSIHTGYIGRWLLGQGAAIPFRCYDKIWDCYHAAKPEEVSWVQLTSWNDFAETGFYPRSFDMGAYCEVIQAFNDQYVRQLPPPAQQEPKLYFAYDRETIPGTLLRIEVLNAPIQRKGQVTLTGRILGNDGQVMAVLDEKKLETSEFGRFDWLIPSASLAVSNVLVPEVTISYNDEDGKTVEQTRRLPHAMLFTPWIQNNSQVRMPFHGLAENINSSLSVSQTGNLLEAELDFSASEPIIRATLWRNDKIVGDFRPDINGVVINFSLSMKSYSPFKYEVRLKNGRYIGSVRRYGFGPDMNNPWLTENSQVFIPGYIGVHSCQAVFQEGGELEILKDGEVIGTIVPEALPGAGSVWFGDKDVLLICQDLCFASPVNPQPYSGKRKIKVLLNESRDNDLFYVHFLTADGKSGFSRVEAPFCMDTATRPMTLLNTYVNNQTRDDRMGYLDDNISREQSAGVYEVNPLCVRKAFWTFDVKGEDLDGYRPFFTEEIAALQKPEGPDGSNCLVFDDNEALLPQRVYPIANGTIEFDLFVAEGDFRNANIMASYTFYNTFDNIGIGTTADGHLQAVYGAARTKISSMKSMEPNAWHHVKFVFKETEIQLFLDDELQAKADVPLWRSTYNGCMKLGDKQNGFKGKLDNLHFDVAWEE